MAEKAVAVETSGSLSDSQLDSILNEILPPSPDLAAGVAPAAPEPSTTPKGTAAAPVETPSVTTGGDAAAVPTKTATDDGFVPPPSVLAGSETPPADAGTGAADDPYGTMPEEPPAGISKGNKEQYRKWRDSHEALKGDLRKAQEQLKSKPAQDPGLVAQIEDLTKRNLELNSIVERRFAQEHPHVRRTFDEPRQAAVKDAEKALTLARLDPAAIAGILALPEIDRVAAVDELYEKIDSESVKLKLRMALDKVEAIDEQKANFLSDLDGNIKNITEQEKAEQSRRFQEQEKNLASAVDATIEHFADKLGFEFLKKSTEPGFENWNARVESDRALIKELAMTNKDPQRYLSAIVAGVTAPHYRMAWQNGIKKIGELTAEIARLKGVVPNLNGKPTTEIPSGGHDSDGLDSEMRAAGITKDDDLATQARKLGAYLQSK